MTGFLLSCSALLPDRRLRDADGFCRPVRENDCEFRRPLQMRSVVELRDHRFERRRPNGTERIARRLCLSGCRDHHNRRLPSRFAYEATLADLLAKPEANTAEETCAAITEALHDYGEARPFDDDVTIVVSRYDLSRPC